MAMIAVPLGFFQCPSIAAAAGCERAAAGMAARMIAAIVLFIVTLSRRLAYRQVAGQ
jgi:hypothetical protein